MPAERHDAPLTPLQQVVAAAIASAIVRLIRANATTASLAQPRTADADRTETVPSQTTTVETTGATGTTGLPRLTAAAGVAGLTATTRTAKAERAPMSDEQRVSSLIRQVLPSASRPRQGEDDDDARLVNGVPAGWQAAGE